MPNPINPTATSPWLNPRRIRHQALLLATALWLGYAMTLATPGMRDRFGHLKGADFLHAYILGTVALEHRGDALYDAGAQREIGEQRVPESKGDYFLPVYGPQYSLIWAPLALLPYNWAAAIWMVLSVAIYAACCYAVWKTCPNLRSDGTTLVLLAAAFPGFFALITFGQNSALALACFAATYFALRRRREVLAGLFLGLLAYKPQLALVPACVFLAACLWRWKAPSIADGESRPAGTTNLGACKVVVGVALSVAVQFAIAWAWYGARPLVAYAHVLARLGSNGNSSMARILEPKPYLMHSLRAFWDLLLPWPVAAFVLYVVTSLAAIALAIWSWRRAVALAHGFAVMLLATVLVAPHLTVYDLVILAPAFLWIGDWLQTHASPQIAWLLYLAYVLPFAGPLARWTHLQLSVICFAVLAVGFCRAQSAENPQRSHDRGRAVL